MTTWIDPSPVAVPGFLSEAVGGHPLIAQILVQRGMVDVERTRAFLDPAFYTPASPFDLPDMDRAVQRVQEAIAGGQRIAVWGDFDVDGQTATTLLVQTLRGLGGEVDFHIPLRDQEGHGVNLPWLDRLMDAGARLVVTCDTGIDARESVEHARRRGVDFVITDHHDLPPALPQASAVVNPKRLPGGHPLATLPGVGVAYKLAEALNSDASQHLDLVALGIVADVALQVGDARYLLQRGLESLRRTPRLGLQAMLQSAQVNPAWLNEEHIGFELGPRLNALGRLGDANLAVEFLTTEDAGRAQILTTILEGLNAQRKRLTDQVFQGALAQIERDPSLAEQAALVLAHPDWPAGVIGIVASRLVERFHRPVVLFAAPPGQLARGSARSVEGCNISAAIAAQSALLAGFGGHPMAAGLSIDPQRIAEFRRRLARSVEAQLGQTRTEPALAIDGVLPLADLSLELVADLERLSPFGAGNPAPVLVSRGHSVAHHRPIGRQKDHLLVTVNDDGGSEYRVLWWQGAGWPVPEGRFELAYRARAATFRGQRDVQIEWIDARPVATAVIETATPSIEVLDWRAEPEPLVRLAELRRLADPLVWAEAGRRGQVNGADRLQLAPADVLVIWTAPAGGSELAAALAQVRPRQVVLVGVDAGTDAPDLFLQRLAGLVKPVLAGSGEVSVRWLAAATAQREAAVQAGLDWLAQRGHLRVVESKGDQLKLAKAAGASAADAPAAAHLREILSETAAYRRYFARADADYILQAVSGPAE